MSSKSQAIVALTRSAALAAGDVGGLARELTEAAAEAIDVQRVSVWRFDADRTRLRCIDLFDVATGQHSGAPDLIAEAYPAYFAALERARVLDASEGLADPRTCELAESYLVPLDVRSLLDAPIRHDGALVGVVCHESVGAQRRWTDSEQAFAASLGDVISLALQTRARLAATEALHEVEQLRAQGRFAAGVAHDFGNLLQAVRARADLIRLQSSERDKVERHVAELLHAVDRGQALVSRLVDYARSHEQRLETVDLRAFLGRVDGLVRDVAGADRQVSISPHPGAVEVDPLQLERALLNLVANARQATSPGGRIQVRVAPCTRPPVALRADQDWVGIAVHDDGEGMDEATRRRALDPWYTTRKQGGGLGLAIAHGVATGAGGALLVDSAPGDGTTMTLCLPCVDNARAQA